MMEIIVTVKRLRSDHLKRSIYDCCAEYLKGILSEEQLVQFEKILFEAFEGCLLSESG